MNGLPTPRHSWLNQNPDIGGGEFITRVRHTGVFSEQSMKTSFLLGHGMHPILKRYCVMIFLICLGTASGCRTSEHKAASSVTTQESRREQSRLLEHRPIDKPFVRVVGAAFAKTGYLVWQPGLTLSWIEHEIGYNPKFGVPIAVSINRNDKKIYEKGATDWNRGTAPGAGQIKPKPDAPELKPGDVVVADRWLDF